MTDNRYSLSQLDVRAGETVRLVFHNQGKVLHEAVIGDAARQDAHEKEMAAMGAMPMTEPGAVSVEPGATGELTYTFKSPGHLLIGCHEPGHYRAGMKISVNIA